jgi:hypothetical protein
MRSLSALALVCVLATNAAAEITPKRVVIAGQVDRGGPWTTGPTEARADQKPRLAAVVEAREGRRTIYIADESIEPLVIGRRTIPARARRGWEALAGAAVRWSTVEPHAWRDRAKRHFHSNVSTEPGSFGRWLGYSTVSYFATPLGRFSDTAAARIRAATIASSDPETRRARLGTIGSWRARGSRRSTAPGSCRRCIGCRSAATTPSSVT